VEPAAQWLAVSAVTTVTAHRDDDALRALPGSAAACYFLNSGITTSDSAAREMITTTPIDNRHRSSSS